MIPGYLKLKGTPSYSLTFSPVFFSFFNHFIQVYFPCREIYPFWVYRSAILSTFIELWNHHHVLVLEHFYYPQKFLYSCLQSFPMPTTSPRQLLIFLPLQICLFWTLQINEIILYVIFYLWLPSLSIVCLRFLHVLPCISSSFLLLNNILLYGFLTLFLHSPADWYLNWLLF